VAPAKVTTVVISLALFCHACTCGGVLRCIEKDAVLEMMSAWRQLR
jgi:hypothetical protein